MKFSFAVSVAVGMLALPLVGCGGGAHNCGAPGTNSLLKSDGSCECVPGFVWANPGDDDYSCVQAQYVPQGQCPDGFEWQNGQCVPIGCTPDCVGRVCGLDPVCGESCGTCPDGATCTVEGKCVAGCIPDCSGRACGLDPVCGEPCGTCPEGTFCNSQFVCETGECIPDCSGRVCGPDPVCGQSCGTCADGSSCNGVGQCVPTGTGSPVGGPCTQDADCEGDPVQCLTEADGFPGGFCVLLMCHTVGSCPEGSTCFYLNQEQTESACFPDCTTGADCRESEGYVCDEYNTCWVDSGPGPEGNVGDPCTSATDCTGAADTCLTEAEGAPGGYCTQLDCSNGTCPEGSECFQFDDASMLCLKTCVGDTCRDGYACYDPGACWVGGGGGCTPEDCADGTFCASNGECVPEPTDMPQGPVPDCSNVISWECSPDEAYCGQVVAFAPNTGDGWWDYPINGETESNEYRSYSRRDLMQLVKHASSKTRCLTEAWTYGNGGPIGLGDMSEANGAIPGTSVGQPGHPQGTHEDGHDMDLGYFQVGTQDNRLRAVCDHYANGQEQYHCVGPADLLDGWRTAVFIAALHDSPQLRVIGVDGKVGPDVDEKIAQLCQYGWLDGTACTSPRMTYEETDQGYGWFHFHHHHFHMSIVDRPSVGWMSGLPPVGWYSSCLTPDCSTSNWDAHLQLDVNAPKLQRPPRQ
ncbi:hypothetical protein ACFL6C_02330 [Myxococcota bacterium]